MMIRASEPPMKYRLPALAGVLARFVATESSMLKTRNHKLFINTSPVNRIFMELWESFVFGTFAL
jgi:hypothetical protein